MNKTLNSTPFKSSLKIVPDNIKYPSPKVGYEKLNGKSKIEINPKNENEDYSDFTKNIKEIAVEAFNKASRESFDMGFPIEIDLDGLLIRLNPDKTYEILENRKKELNTITTIYL